MLTKLIMYAMAHVAISAHMCAHVRTGAHGAHAYGMACSNMLHDRSGYKMHTCPDSAQMHPLGTPWCAHLAHVRNICARRAHGVRMMRTRMRMRMKCELIDSTCMHNIHNHMLISCPSHAPQCGGGGGLWWRWLLFRHLACLRERMAR